MFMRILRSTQHIARFPEIWVRMAVREFQVVYGKGPLGVAWVVIEGLVLAIAISVASSSFQKVELSKHFTHVLIGLTIFHFFENIINSSSTSLNHTTQFIKTNIDIAMLIFSNWLRIVSTFLINLVVAITVSWSNIDLGQQHLLLFIAVPINLLTGLGLSLVLCTYMGRIRDLSLLFKNLNRILLFACPIFWYRENLNNNAFLEFIEVNPISVNIEMTRSLLVEKEFELWDIQLAFAYMVISLIVGSIIFERNKSTYRNWVVR